MIAEAAADLMPVQESIEPEPTRDVPVAPIAVASAPVRPRARLGLISVVLVAVVIGVLSMGRSMLQRQTQLSEPHTNQGLAAPPPAEVIRPGSLQMPQQQMSDEDRGPGLEQSADRVQRPREVPPPAVAKPRAGGAPEAAAEVLTPTPATLSAPNHSLLPEAGVADAAVRAAKAAVDPDEPETPEIVARAPDPEPAAPPVWREAPVSHTIEVPEPASEKGAMRLIASRFDRVTVRPGDSISRIALRKYGQASHTILDLIKLANPELDDVDVISVGQTLQLPDLSESSVLSYGANRFGVLVYSTTQLARATALVSALRARGQRTRVVKGELGARDPVYRVVIDGFADAAAATAASREIQRLFREDERMALLVR